MVNILILTIILLTTEFILQLIKPYALYKRTEPREIKDGTFKENAVKVNWMQADSSLGWVCSTSDFFLFSNPFFNKTKIKYTINKEGYRSHFDYSVKLPSKKHKIMLLGDSFLFGVYLDYTDTVVGFLEQSDSINYYMNFGIPGYGIDQMFITFRKYYSTLNPDVVILIYTDDDIPRILESYRLVEGLNKPSFNIFANTFEYRSEQKQSFLLDVLNNSYLLNKFYQKYLDYYAVKFTQKIFLQLRKESSNKLVVIRWPNADKLYWNKIDWYYDLKEYFNNNNINYINLADAFTIISEEKRRSFFLARDGHPSKEGNQFLAILLYRVIGRILKR